MVCKTKGKLLKINKTNLFRQIWRHLIENNCPCTSTFNTSIQHIQIHVLYCYLSIILQISSEDEKAFLIEFNGFNCGSQVRKRGIPCFLSHARAPHASLQSTSSYLEPRKTPTSRLIQASNSPPCLATRNSRSRTTASRVRRAKEKLYRKALFYCFVNNDILINEWLYCSEYK